ncbi:MAG: redoxin domain-containing protein [Candidatus Zixiibacteriota bacterium]|nr:MAG: redoxin domain-containing protein [candidate division Zixibacteria bacterium]
MGNVNRLRVGLFAPDFILKDSEGRKLSLSHFSGKKNLLLFFCKTLNDSAGLSRSEELNRFYDQIRLRDTEVLALSRDERWISRRVKQERKIQFPILKIEGDPGNPSSTPPVSELYGIVVRESEGTALYPAVFIVDKGGTVRFRKVYTQPTDRLHPDDLLCELDKLG